MILTYEREEKCENHFSFLEYMSGGIDKKTDTYNGQSLANKLLVLRPIKQPKRVACCGTRRRSTKLRYIILFNGRYVLWEENKVK